MACQEIFEKKLRLYTKAFSFGKIRHEEGEKLSKTEKTGKKKGREGGKILINARPNPHKCTRIY
jgi:hypothetical protein